MLPRFQLTSNRPAWQDAKLGLWLLCALWFCESAGCARWHSQTNSDSSKALASVPASPDTVDIETVVVRFKEEQLSELDQAWRASDEAFLQFEQRRLLDTNGLRVGLLRGELPPVLSQQLQANYTQHKSDIVEQAGLGSDATHSMRLLRCRAGRRTELVIRQAIKGDLSVLTSLDGQLSGLTFSEQPTVLFGLTSFPSTDGQAVLELVPEIQHGQQRSSFVTNEFGVRREARRGSTSWKQLKVRAQMSPGNTLMIAATQPTKSLGNSFFVTDTAIQTQEHLVLLVRLNATQLDDLFDDEKIGVARALMEQ